MIKIYTFQLNMAGTIVFCDNLSDVPSHIKICYHKYFFYLFIYTVTRIDSTTFL